MAAWKFNTNLSDVNLKAVAKEVKEAILGGGNAEFLRAKEIFLNIGVSGAGEYMIKVCINFFMHLEDIVPKSIGDLTEMGQIARNEDFVIVLIGMMQGMNYKFEGGSIIPKFSMIDKKFIADEKVSNQSMIFC